jgi:dipicolinate synthase subunit A
MNKKNAGFPQDWASLVIAIVGGDEREQEIARLAAKTGATVAVFGFPWPGAGIPSVRYAENAAEALKGANVAFFPIPGMTTDGAIFATEKIVPDENLLKNMAPGAHIILGTADKALKETANRLDIGIHEYETDQRLMLLRAPAIVEGVLRIIIENTDVTIHKANVCVVGQGNIGTALTRSLVLLGAKVTVAARNPVQRANAYTLGADSITIGELKKQVASFSILISTVPAAVINKAVIDDLEDGTLLVDISAPPGSIDLEYAKSRGVQAVWARAMGRRAPVTVGASQWSGISITITELMQGASNQ